jgi:hypothetical protein
MMVLLSLFPISTIAWEQNDTFVGKFVKSGGSIKLFYVDFLPVQNCRPSVSLMLMNGRKLGRSTGSRQIYDEREYMHVQVNDKRHKFAPQENRYTNGVEFGAFLTNSLLADLRVADSLTVTLGSRGTHHFSKLKKGGSFNKHYKRAQKKCR